MVVARAPYTTAGTIIARNIQRQAFQARARSSPAPRHLGEQVVHEQRQEDAEHDGQLLQREPSLPRIPGRGRLRRCRPARSPEATPTPTPPTIRKNTSDQISGRERQPTALTKNRTAAIFITFRRPDAVGDAPRSARGWRRRAVGGHRETEGRVGDVEVFWIDETAPLMTALS